MTNKIVCEIGCQCSSVLEEIAVQEKAILTAWANTWKEHDEVVGKELSNSFRAWNAGEWLIVDKVVKPSRQRLEQQDRLWLESFEDQSNGFATASVFSIGQGIVNDMTELVIERRWIAEQDYVIDDIVQDKPACL